MPALLELQKEVNRVYCLATYGDDNLRRLTKDDKDKLELLVKVDKGSSWYETLLQGPVAKIMQDAAQRMSIEQLITLLLVFGVLLSGHLGWKAWLGKQISDKELDIKLDLAKLENERLAIVTQAITQSPLIAQVAEVSNVVRTELLSKLKPDDSLDVVSKDAAGNKTTLTITGDDAGSITQTVREPVVERIVQGEFFLQAADFNKDNHVRITLRRVDDDYIFSADVPMDALEAKDLDALKNDSWNKKNIPIKMLVREKNGKYTSAKVISVETT